MANIKMLLDNTDSSWHKILENALSNMDEQYLATLINSTFLPGKENIFNAFNLPLNKTKYILFGESPYPRRNSANGYAFWDGAVLDIWSTTGLSKEVNRATSLRNIIKMLLRANGELNQDCSQLAITKINKEHKITKLSELFHNLLNNGFLLLNASLVLSKDSVRYDAEKWHPFMQSLLLQLANKKPSIKLILFGKIAEKINKICPDKFTRLQAEHPYNLSFIHNNQVNEFFKPFKLLEKNCLIT